MKTISNGHFIKYTREYVFLWPVFSRILVYFAQCTLKKKFLLKKKTIQEENILTTNLELS